MSNASLKEQLQAVASQLCNKKVENVQQPKKKSNQPALKTSPKSNQSKLHAKPSKPKPKWLDYVQYGVELLKAYFPLCFKAGSEVRPLKKGIKQDLVKHLSTLENMVTEDKACMVKSLAYYVNTMAYHKNVIEGAVRIDLEGQPDGIVTAEEAKYSLERQHAKIQAKQIQSVSTRVENKVTE
jgi:ProP effector